LLACDTRKNLGRWRIPNYGLVHGGTSGRAAHIFEGMLHGATGVVFDR
jgi:hypothetical protein